jgi:hypothetical protein
MSSLVYQAVSSNLITGLECFLGETAFRTLEVQPFLTFFGEHRYLFPLKWVSIEYFIVFGVDSSS